ncbi:MAG TPA: class I SAM-dependent methyltransferase [Gelidibacter sp.]|uniref:class I SAM-dependent methyltransferase n=1 Tax=Gelidibacter sp. TaxID=2018083 RepID=UPI002B9F9E66|nr:class I SAM-dependent methyltransferase [Gelidibacter sp.]HXJ98952.1 class I SAM-dependent methyltransferase [Gelidibacter sp.]
MSNSTSIHNLKVKDHSVSKENFELRFNTQLELLETFPQPSPEKLSEYYKSEDYISHTDAKRNVFEKLYHAVKVVALKRKIKLINNVSSNGKTLLDIGCGTGDFLQVAHSSGWQISGIEPNEQARDLANKKVDNVVFDTEQLSKFESYSFDVITLWHVLEHLPNVEEHFSIFKKLLKPNGVLIIAVPNYKSYDAQLYKEFWAAYDVPRHLWHFSQASIKRLGEKIKMDVVKIVPMTFDAFYVSLLSEKYKSGKMNFVKGFWNGWRSNWKARRSGEYSSLIYVLKNKNT